MALIDTFVSIANGLGSTLKWAVRKDDVTNEHTPRHLEAEDQRAELLAALAPLATAAAQAAAQTTLEAIVTALGGTLAVSASELPLPTGAATAGIANAAAPSSSEGQSYGPSYDLFRAMRILVMGPDGQPLDYGARSAVYVGGRLRDLTFSTDTTAYASGDVIADFQEVADAVAENDAIGNVVSLCLLDKANQKAALNLVLARASTTLGAENSAPSLSDANSFDIEAVIPIATSDYVSFSTGFAVASIGAIAKKFRPEVGTRKIYAALLNGTGAPTYGASDLAMHLGIDD